MSEFFNLLFQNFSQYVKLSRWDFEFFLYLFGSLVVIILLTLALLAVINTRRDPLRLRVFQILRVSFIALCIGLFGLIGLISCFVVTGSYYSHPVQFSHLLTLVILSIILVALLFFFSRHFRDSRLHHITPLPVNDKDATDKKSKLNKSFNRLKLWYLLPLAGFLFLLIIYTLPKNLISVVIDNSDTMLEMGQKGESKFETARDALGATIGNIGPLNHFVVTSIDRSALKHDFATITSTTDFSKLRGISQFFTDQESTLSYITSLPLGGDSPITEIIYNNMLFIQKNVPVNKYSNIYLLIITDCRENGCLNDLQEGKNFLCKESRFNDLFTGEQVTLIDLEGNYNNQTYVNNPDLIFLQRMIDCGFTVEDGSTEDSYLDSLSGVLERFFFDKHMILWAIVIYLIHGLFVFLINPKNR
jgi:hypothetical protein